MRIAVIGRGTAGALTAAKMYSTFNGKFEIIWHYDSSIKPQSVGEGSALPLLSTLNGLDWSYSDMDAIDSNYKVGIHKSGWGKDTKPFDHNFLPGTTALHFNAVQLQNYIFNKIKDKVTLVDGKVTSHDDIDADYIIDCSGKPFNYDEFEESPFIPINSAYVTQCPWEYPRFQHTLTVTRPYGWIFGIPLKNRCSIGYMFNSDINSLDEVKEDVKDVFQQYNLIPSDKTNFLQFKNYSRKVNFQGRVSYNGNASFFFDPLEATSITNIDNVGRFAYNHILGYWDDRYADFEYHKKLYESQVVIMLHYFAGSDYDTDFWKYATMKGEQCISDAVQDPDLKPFIDSLSEYNSLGEIQLDGTDYGTWWKGSFYQNIKSLGIEQKIKKLYNGI